jgi:hypothetical protein
MNYQLLLKCNKVHRAGDDVTIAMDVFAPSTDGSSSSRSRGGRPKGSTKEVKHHAQREIVDANNYCAIDFLHLKKNRA